MSWEAWGSGDDPVDPEQLYRLGWDCDETCEKWWKIGEPEDVYTLKQVIEWYWDWASSAD